MWGMPMAPRAGDGGDIASLMVNGEREVRRMPKAPRGGGGDDGDVRSLGPVGSAKCADCPGPHAPAKAATYDPQGQWGARDVGNARGPTPRRRRRP